MEDIKKYKQFFERVVTEEDLTALHDQIHQAEKSLQDAKEEAEKYLRDLKEDKKSKKHTNAQNAIYRLKDALQNCQLAKKHVKDIK